MKKHALATLVVFLILVGSDMAIGSIGHFVGGEHENVFEYFMDSNNWFELVIVFFIALLIVTFLRFGLPLLGLPSW
ncbi:MAG: hypothetical protein KGY50_02310 [Candidatus Thermoplasmatota archaeon]|nr:hypothetical protein [Candidatus Thermoplasmatota archaeon]